MLSAETLSQHAKVNKKKVFNACYEILLHSSKKGQGIGKVKLNLCIRTVSSGSSLDCSCLFMYSIVSVNLSGQRS